MSFKSIHSINLNTKKLLLNSFLQMGILQHLILWNLILKHAGFDFVNLGKIY